MRQIFFASFFALGLALPVSLSAAEPDGTAIQGVISDQIDAFRAGDMIRAFDFASDGIRHFFVTPESFGQMVTGGYAVVTDPAEVRFLDLRELGGALWQMVLMKDAAGVWHTLDYEMVQEDGAWRIDGVQFLRRAEVGV